MTIHDSIIEYTDSKLEEYMVKLCLKWCDRKPYAIWRTRSNVDFCSYIHNFILYMNEGVFGSVPFVPLYASLWSFFFYWVVMQIVHVGACVESIDWFLRHNNLGLTPINKLEQLCKYIFDIEIKRIGSSKFSIKENRWNYKTFLIHSVSHMNQPSVWF